MDFYQHVNKNTQTAVFEYANISLDQSNIFSLQILKEKSESDGTMEVVFSASEKLEDYMTYLVFYPSTNNKYIYNGYALTYGTGIKLNNYLDIFFNKATMKNYYQIDTGCLARGEVAIKSFIVPYQQTKFEDLAAKTPMLNYEGYSVLRYQIWARFALILPSGEEFKTEEYGRAVNEGGLTFSTQTPAVLSMSDAQTDEAGLKYFELSIKKWDAKYRVRLEEEIDNTLVQIEATSGILNTSRVILDKGNGSFRLYPYGYKGDMKVKLGFRYYNPWCEYLVTITD